MKAYVLHNDELGYTTCCPVYKIRKEAEEEMAYKCRRHSVHEVNAEDYEPCTPKHMVPDCLHCARCSATEDQRREYVREKNEQCAYEKYKL